MIKTDATSMKWVVKEAKTVTTNDRSSRRGFLTILGAGLADCLASGCGRQAQAPARGKPGVSSEVRPTLRIGHIPITDHLILGISHERDSEGFKHCNLEPVKFKAWPQLAEGLKNGDLQGAFILAPLAVALALEGAPLKVTLLGHRDGSALIVKVGPEVNTVEDLKGKLMALPHKLSIHNILLHKVTTEAGLEYGRDVRTTMMAPPKMPAALSAGEIDGYVVAEPFGAQAEEYGVGKILMLSKDIWENHICCVLVMRREVLKEQREAVKELMASLVRSGIFIQENPEEASAIGGRFLGQARKTVFRALVIPEGRVTFQDLAPTHTDFEELQDYMVDKMSLLREKIDCNEFVDMQYAQDAYDTVKSVSSARNEGLSREPIKVGILHSLSGTMAISEKSVVDATLLAIEEINDQGGLLGRKVRPIVMDGRSDWPTFAELANKLVVEKKVSVVFGCWTSASRKTVKPVFEQHDHLLFYPVQYEGLEQSPNIVYTGAAPNQQIIPAINWCYANLGKRFFLVGSDYVFPRTASAIMRDRIGELGGEIAGEEYVLLGSKQVEGMVQKILETRPDVILNTINGDSNVAFFRQLGKAGITPDKIPTMSFSLAEDELLVLGVANMTGNYACWNYFQSIDSEQNRSFVKRFRRRYGSYRVTDDPMEAGYFGVYLWAEAVKRAGTPDPKDVRKAVGGLSFRAPEGLVSVDPDTQHTRKSVRVGRIRPDGQFDIVWRSEEPIFPEPFPESRTRSEWNEFLQNLYVGWSDNWAKPGE